jgi:hypothetical protein
MKQNFGKRKKPLRAGGAQQERTESYATRFWIALVLLKIFNMNKE